MCGVFGFAAVWEIPAGSSESVWSAGSSEPVWSASADPDGFGYDKDLPLCC
ncbi:hypothetical protein ACFV6E_40000 [Streptomyces sp. NPDC059785]|uniref:hypothetical protein n=1 Tax=unclassified Streptomyces TaxID=2593676 RepID=UPI00365E7DC4